MTENKSASATAPVPGSSNPNQGGGDPGAAPATASAPSSGSAKAVRFISKFKRYKLHLGKVVDTIGDEKISRLVTVQFHDLTYITDEKGEIEKIRKAKAFRGLGDHRPGGEFFEMKEGENIRSAMDRLGIKDTGSPVQNVGAVDTTQARSK